MKVRLFTNIGSRDADMLGLDHAKCVVGAEISASDDASSWLVSRGYAEVVETKKVRAVSDDPSVTGKPKE